MIDNQTHTLVDNKTGEMVFKLYRFESLRHFDHIQRLNYYSLIWIQRGNGKAQIETEKYSYADHHLFACSPYQPFMFQAETKTQGVVVNFHPNFFCIHKHHTEVACDGVLFNNIYEYPYFKVNQSEGESLNWIISEMEKDIQQNSLAINEAILSYLKLFLINCSRIKKQNYPEIQLDERQDQEKFIVQQLKKFIENRFRTLHSPKEYADLLHISPNALSKIVKAAYNKTTSALIAERIIIEAKRELYLTNKSVEEIAAMLGYDDSFYFSRFFKKHTNISPSLYRKTVGYNRAAKL
ncbi:MAG: helix-turn-helix domain-containing protein [Candidatus Cyclobacteriaceae bacterium M3_2C_046]